MPVWLPSDQFSSDSELEGAGGTEAGNESQDLPYFGDYSEAESGYQADGGRNSPYMYGAQAERAAVPPAQDSDTSDWASASDAWAEYP